MKTIVVKTEKVTSHEKSGMPIIEITNQKISPELTFNKFIKYLPSQNYSNVTVLRVLENGKEVDEIENYQTMIDESLTPKTKPGEEIDYKALSEKQSAQLNEALQRIEALEDKKPKVNSEDRKELEAKANELNITFRSNIGDEKLLNKIQEIKPDFKLN